MQKKMIIPVVLVAVCAICALGAYALLARQAGKPDSLEARLESRILPVSPGIAGKVAEVLVRPGEAVKAGQELYRLDDAEALSNLEEARAELAELDAAFSSAGSAAGSAGSEQAYPAGDAENLLSLARRQENAARRAMEEKSEARAKAVYELARVRARAQKDAAEAEKLAFAQDAAKSAENEFALALEDFESASAARSALEMSLRSSSSWSAEAESAGRLAYQAARDEMLLLAEAAVEAQVIRAPFPGYVLEVQVRAGDEIAANGNALSIMPFDPEHIWFGAYFPIGLGPEPGQLVRIILDEPELTLQGRIDNVLEAERNGDGAELRIPVRVSILDYDPENMPPLRPGLTAGIFLPD